MSTERKATIGLAVAAGTLLLLAALSFGHARQTVQLSHDLRSAQAILTELESLLSLMQGAESDARRFVITGDDADRLSPAQIMQQVESRIQSLRAATQGSSEQARRLDTLQADIQQRIGLLTQVADLRTQQGFEASQAFTRAGLGQREMEQVEATIAQLRIHVETQRDTTAAAFERSARSGTIAFGSMAGLEILLV